MDPFQIELLGFIAGATNLVSSVPQLVANLRSPNNVRGQNTSRNCLQAAGNILWLLYGLQVGSTAMATFASLGAFMASVLAFQTARGNLAGTSPASSLFSPAGINSRRRFI